MIEFDAEADAAEREIERLEIRADSLIDECRALKGDLREALDLLRDYLPRRYDYVPGYCMWCGRRAVYPDDPGSEPHEDRCRLAALLAKHPETK